MFGVPVDIDPRGRPQSRPVVITIFTQSVRTSVHTSVPNLQHQATITASRDYGLAEWIIDDSSKILIVTIFHFVMRFPLLD